MPKVTFEYNLGKIEDHIKKEDTFYRETLSPTERLTVCLRKEESSHDNSVLVRIIVYFHLNVTATNGNNRNFLKFH